MKLNHHTPSRISFRRAIALALLASGLASISAQAEPVSAWHAISPASALANAHLIGHAEADQPVSIAIQLKPRNQALLQSFVADVYRPGSPSFHHWMSRQQTKEFFSPTQEQAQAVADYLRQHGFDHIEIAPNRLLITAQGRVDAATRAFHTSIAKLSLEGRAAIANLQDIQVPATLPQIDRVLGLQTLQQAHTMSLPPRLIREASNDKPTPAPAQSNGWTRYGTSNIWTYYYYYPNGFVAYYPNGFVGANNRTYYYPDEFATAYHAGNMPTAHNTSAAIIGWGRMDTVVKDLEQFESARGVSPVPTQVVTIGRESTDNKNEREWAMDAQAIVGISGGVKSLIFYAAYNGYNHSLVQAINQAVSDNTAKVINISWLVPCEGYSTGWADSLFELGIAQGQTFAAASGDNGAYACGVTKGNGSYGTELGVGYPASSPYVVSMGGTTLHTTSDHNYLLESAWPYSGGGVSRYEAKPSWQNMLPGSYRWVPDLAFDADQDHSGIAYYLYTGTSEAGWYVSGGTSLSAPLFVGAWARLESANGNRLGFAVPAIYAYAQQKGLPLHDVTSSNNGYYLADSGWDPITGWGSFDMEAFNDFIHQHPEFIKYSKVIKYPKVIKTLHQ